MKFKQLLLIVAVSAASAVGSVWIYNKVADKNVSFIGGSQEKAPANYAGFFGNVSETGDVVDFTKAATAVVPAVVHIKTKIAARKVTNDLPRNRGDEMEDFFDQFFNFGPQMRIQPEQRASGSGVIISEDGYIVTNNHVVSDGGKGVAEEITVTLNENKKTYKARVIGRDPSSDIAVLKVDDKNLPYAVYGNSDNLQLGQWVLAVGYPLTLEATVTAGIISAKGRSIGINSRQSDSPVEYFIQTDAAVNQGNSGGALINTNGELIGINSAILAPTGTYAGYSFAIPVNIIRKIVNDLIQYGDVKRGYLGVNYSPSDNEMFVKRAGVANGRGVYVQAVPSDGAAYKAGLKKGDIITSIDGYNVSSGVEMSGRIASMKPGDKIKLNYTRDGKEYSTNVTLTETVSKTQFSSAEYVGDRLGIELENLDSKKAEQYKVAGGVIVKKILSNGPLTKTRMEPGFIITAVNGNDISNTDELAKVLGSGYNKVTLEGIYPGYNGVYQYQINMEESNEN